MSPVRIQRRRTAGWRMPEGAVNCCRPGPWGNPYVLAHARSGRLLQRNDMWSVSYQGSVLVRWDTKRAAAADAVDRFRRLLGESPAQVEAIRTHLAGKDLCCWCPLDQPCHADVLLEIANGGAA
jgi:hypothetical protein